MFEGRASRLKHSPMVEVDLRVVAGGPEDAWIDRFSSLRVVVVGEAMLDAYIKGAVTRLCPDGPVPVVDITAHEVSLGGAANVAANLAALGADVSLVSAVGMDSAGDDIVRLAKEYGISVDGVVRDSGRTTLTKRRVVGDDRTLVRIDGGTIRPLSAHTEATVVDRLGNELVDVDVVVVSDYRYGVLTDRVVARLAEETTPVVVDSKNLARFQVVSPRAVTSNYAEVVGLDGALPVAGGDRVDQLREMGERIAAATGAAAVAVTLDSDGVAVIESAGRFHHIPSTGDATDPCGAGDTFTAAMALSLAAGASPYDSAMIANRAAAVVISRPGTAICTLDQLRGVGHSKTFWDVGRLLDHLAMRRARGESVVFTNGCFDVLHAGHVASLAEAAQLGDILVVGLNGDESVRRLKGPDRPVHEASDRAAVLAGLSVVDHVVIFHEDSPLELLERLKPEVYCKGGDYRGKPIPEVDLVRSWGGRFQLTGYLPDRSTTATVERVRSTKPSL